VSEVRVGHLPVPDDAIEWDVVVADVVDPDLMTRIGEQSGDKDRCADSAVPPARNQARTSVP